MYLGKMKLLESALPQHDGRLCKKEEFGGRHVEVEVLQQEQAWKDHLRALRWTTRPTPSFWTSGLQSQELLRVSEETRQRQLVPTVLGVRVSGRRSPAGVGWGVSGRGERGLLGAPPVGSALGARPVALRTLRLGLAGSGAVVMSTAMNFGTKNFQPRPPDKGSFPLDHFGERWRSAGRVVRPQACGLGSAMRALGPRPGQDRAPKVVLVFEYRRGN
ncbi:uncharacterized protein LOC111727067 [Otolemur garnettii]|uniref:uncharacterized protein LOC111727067 n=1 Tax=Otolemur garnettii TaxID=30611 RepID=UPI000C7EFF5B|nr:uncharacterized protein LOC111727067 [Otolemur garnettii]